MRQSCQVFSQHSLTLTLHICWQESLSPGEWGQRSSQVTILVLQFEGWEQEEKNNKKSNIKTWLWVSAPRKATVFYSILLESAGVEHRSGVVLSCKGTTTSRLFRPSTADLPRTERSDWGVVISLRTRSHSVHRATPHPSCRCLLTATSFKKQKPFSDSVFQPRHIF